MIKKQYFYKNIISNIMRKLHIITLILFIISFYTSCTEYVFPYMEQEIKYGKLFTDEFGDIPNGHSWDYYSEYALIDTTSTDTIPTRAIQDKNIFITDTIQPEDLYLYKDIWIQYLPERKNNSAKGQDKYTLISNGPFFCNCVWYYSTNPCIVSREFECGILCESIEYPLFGPYEYDVKKYGGINPGFSKLIDLGRHTAFKFYIRYKNSGNTVYLISDEYSKLLFSNITSNKQIIIIGFEDTPFNKNSDKDFNDVILYIIGNPDLPILESKRFFCEDLGKIENSDFDYNDIVFDVHPMGDSTEVIIQALGGTLPIKLYVGGVLIGGDDLHKVLKTNYKQYNVGIGFEGEPYSEIIPLKIDNLSTFENVVAKVGHNFETTILYKTNTTGPAIITVPAKAKWMREYKNIKLGYPNFFDSHWYDFCETQYVIDK